MAEQYDGFLRLKTLIETKDASSQMLKMGASADKLKRSIEQLTAKKKDLEEMKVPTEDFKKAQEELKAAEEELKKFTDQIKMYQEMGLDTKVITEWDQGFKDAEATVKRLRGEIKAMQEEGKAYMTGAEADPTKYTNIQNQLANQENALQAVYARARELAAANEAKIVAGIQGTVNKALSIIKTGITIAGNILKTFANGAIKALSIAGHAMASRLIEPLQNFAQHGQSGLDIVERLSKKIWGLAKRVFIFTVITKALRAFRAGLTDANDTWKELDDTSRKTAYDIRRAFQGWQDEIVTAFNPILNIILPKITEGINQVTEATRTFGQLVSGITGSDVYERMARGAEDYDEALGDINKDQKKTQKGLAGFDKLDVLNGGNKGATKEIEKITDDVKDLVDLLKEGKYEEFGAEIARRMEDGLKKIKWGPIKQAATNAGSMLSRIINGVFSQGGLAEQAGRNVAEGINTIASAFNGFFRQFKGNEFGKFFANIFGGLAKNVEFKKIRDVITNGANEIINVYKGFWENMKKNAVTLGEGFGDIINGIFNDINLGNITQGFKEKIMALSQFITSAIVNIDWEGAARNISDAIDNLINGVVEDAEGNLVNVWQKSGQTVGRLIGKVLKTISTVIQNTDFEELGKSIGLWFNNLFAGIDPHELGAGISALVKGIFNMIKGAFSQMDGKAIGQAFEEFWNGLDIDGIKESIKGAFGQVWSTLTDAIANSPALQQAIGTVLGLLFQYLTIKIISFINPLAGIIIGVLTAVFDIIGPRMNAFIDPIVELLFRPVISFLKALQALLKGDLLGFFGNLVGVLNPVVSLLETILKLIDTIAGTDLSAPFNRIKGIEDRQSSAAISGGAQWKPIQTQQQPAQWSSISKNDMKTAFSEALVENADTLSNNGINTVVLDVNGQQLAEATLNDYTNTIQRRGLKADMVFA